MEIFARMGLVVCAFFAAPVWAAQIDVDPTTGADALANAVAAAEAGDTLVLPPGTYYGGFTIDKSLVVRGVNSGDPPMITESAVTVDGAGAHVVLQGLAFTETLNLARAANIQILENRFYDGADISTSAYKTSEGDGMLAIIGNRLNDDSYIGIVYTDDAYIAGNTLSLGYIRTYAPAWIVGNVVNGPPHTAPLYDQSNGNVRIIGNRIRARLDGNSPSMSARNGVSVDAPAALVASNLVQVEHEIVYSYGMAGIYLSSRTVAKVHNNVVDGLSRTNGVTSNCDGMEVRNAESDVSGNMVIRFPTSDINPFAGTFGPDNLCWESSNCPGDVIEVDPLLVDHVDYRLAAGSPAIDAGSDSPYLADRDRTVNDLGIHGGPWGIEQYDAQRDPAYLGPFVFPLFDANAGFVDGALQVRALGVARLR